MERAVLEKRVYEWGGAVFGIADLRPFREEGAVVYPPKGLDRAVSIGVPVPWGAFSGVTDRPDDIYLHHYLQVNAFLDDLGLKVAGFIERAGHAAVAIPASKIIDSAKWLGHISHKAVARMAGLGWQGKNLLIINPSYGGRLRFTTVLTDLDIEADGPIASRCGHCRLCTDACPAGAIRGTVFDGRPPGREEVIDLERCATKLSVDFAQGLGLGRSICGVCIKVCPWSRPRAAEKNLLA